MTATTWKLHLLIAVDTVLANKLWQDMMPHDRPFLIYANPLVGSIGLARTPAGESYRIGVALGNIIERRLSRDPDGAALLYLNECLIAVRHHFDLADDEPLNVAMAGSHSSVSGNADGAQNNSGRNAGASTRSVAENAMRKGRTFAGLVDAWLDELGGFQPHWLTDAFPHLRPAHRPSAYDALAAQARAHLATIKIPPFEGAGFDLRRPAMPLLYVTREQGSADRVAWRLIEAPRRGRPWSVTQALIRQFGAARREEPALRGVLAKLLPDDTGGKSPNRSAKRDESREDMSATRQQNKLDAPMIGSTTITDADDAGLEAILLDARHGVIREPLGHDAMKRLVFGCLPPD